MNCRSIPAEDWGHAREALVFYFSRRHGSDRAEDLAQDALAAIWKREDYQFDKPEDFLKICYAFARQISRYGYRKARRDASEMLSPDMEQTSPSFRGMSGPLLGLLLDDVIRLGAAELTEREWEAICVAAESKISGIAAHSEPESNKLRVQLFRARRKLEKITGWKKSADA